MFLLIFCVLIQVFLSSAAAVKGCNGGTVISQGLKAVFYYYPLWNTDHILESDFFVSGYKKLGGAYHTVDRVIDPNIQVPSTWNYDATYKGCNTGACYYPIYGYSTSFTNFTVELTGYFLPPTSGTYTFSVTADNVAAISFGNPVRCCDDAGNSLLPNIYAQSKFGVGGDWYGFQLIPGVASGTLTAGVYYPIRMIVNNAGGVGVFNFKVINPDGTTSTTLPNVYQMDFNDICEITTTVPWSGGFTLTYTTQTVITTGSSPFTNNLVVVETPILSLSESLTESPGESSSTYKSLIESESNSASESRSESNSTSESPSDRESNSVSESLSESLRESMSTYESLSESLRESMSTSESLNDYLSESASTSKSLREHLAESSSISNSLSEPLSESTSGMSNFEQITLIDLQSDYIVASKQSLNQSLKELSELSELLTSRTGTITSSELNTLRNSQSLSNLASACWNCTRTSDVTVSQVELLTVMLTITSCLDGNCSIVSKPSSKSDVTVIETDFLPIVVTVTLCLDGDCTPQVTKALATTVTKLIGTRATVFTTYCPISAVESETAVSGSISRSGSSSRSVSGLGFGGTESISTSGFETNSGSNSESNSGSRTGSRSGSKNGAATEPGSEAGSGSESRTETGSESSTAVASNYESALPSLSLEYEGSSVKTSIPVAILAILCVYMF